MITPEQAELVKDLVPIDKVYEDALRPAMKQIGGMLGSVLKTARFLLAPIDYAAAFQDRWQRYLQKMSDAVEEGNLVEGQPQLVIPILEGLSLTVEGSLLSELFINLLAKSIDKTQQGFAHPSFPNIISQLSYDEAVILYYLKKNILVGYSIPEDKDMEKVIYDHLDYMPSINVLQFHTHLDMYREHLVSLNLCTNHKHTGFWLSAFGRLFAEACVPNEFPISKLS